MPTVNRQLGIFPPLGVRGKYNGKSNAETMCRGGCLVMKPTLAPAYACVFDQRQFIINKKLLNMKKTIKRGEIYYANLDPTVGSEQKGNRPVVICQNEVGNKHSPTVVVAPITAKLIKNPLPTHVKLYSGKCGISQDSIILTEQIRTIDRLRLGNYIGALDDKAMERLDKALSVSIGIIEKPLILSLCHRCESNFRNAGYILVKRGWQEHKEACNLCHTGMGLDFVVFNREDNEWKI